MQIAHNRSKVFIFGYNLLLNFLWLVCGLKIVCRFIARSWAYLILCVGCSQRNWCYKSPEKEGAFSAGKTLFAPPQLFIRSNENNKRPFLCLLSRFMQSVCGVRHFASIHIARWRRIAFCFFLCDSLSRSPLFLCWSAPIYFCKINKQRVLSRARS